MGKATHNAASESYGFSCVTNLPGNKVGINVGYCCAVRMRKSSIAISGEGASGPPLSTVPATITRKERKKLEEGVPDGTPKCWRDAEAAPRGARSKWSATSVKSVLNAPGPSTPKG